MRKSRFLIYCSLFLLLGCSEVEDIDLTPTKTVSFGNADYQGLRFSGVMTKDSIEYIYFGSSIKRKIDFFEISGKKVCSVPLTEVFEFENDIESIACVHFDTILIKGLLSNKVYCLNCLGKVWKTININNTFKTEFDPTTSINGDFYQKGALFFQCAIPNPTLDSLTQEESVILQSKLSRDHPYFSNIRGCFNEHPRHNFSEDGFYARFISDSCLSIEPPMYSFANNHLLVHSAYSDTIYQINSQNLKIEKAIKITSKYTVIGAKPIKFGEDISEGIMRISQRSGIIINAMYDRYRQLYYLSIRHQVDQISSKRMRAGLCPWSIIILDENLNYLTEIMMAQGQYNPGDLLLTKQGPLVFIYPKKLNTSPQFQLFHVQNNNSSLYPGSVHNFLPASR